MRKTLIFVAIAVLLVGALTPGGLAAAIVFLLCAAAPPLAVLFRTAGSDPVPRPAPLRLSSPERAPPRARA